MNDGPPETANENQGHKNEKALTTTGSNPVKRRKLGIKIKISVPRTRTDDEKHSTVSPTRQNIS